MKSTWPFYSKGLILWTCVGLQLSIPMPVIDRSGFCSPNISQTGRLSNMLHVVYFCGLTYRTLFQTLLSLIEMEFYQFLITINTKNFLSILRLFILRIWIVDTSKRLSLFALPYAKMMLLYSKYVNSFIHSYSATRNVSYSGRMD